jgi:hypothetical protein
LGWSFLTGTGMISDQSPDYKRNEATSMEAEHKDRAIG